MNKVEKVFDKAEDKIDQLMHLGDIALDAFFHASGKGLKMLFDASNLLMQNAHKFYMKHARLLRYGSLPWSIAIPKIYKWMHSNDYDRLPIFIPGMHMIRSRVGGGKSLTSLVLAEMTLKHTGYASYFTSAVEKPQLSEDGTYYYVMHRVINLSEYYKDGKKVMNFNTKKYKNIHKDERHLTYNPRMNKSKEYNSKFIPEHEDDLLMRHGGFENKYMYSQHMKLDSQEMDAITLMHEVETSKDIPIKRWLEDGTFKYIPVKLKFISYSIEINFDGSMKRNVYRKWKIQVPYEVLMKFDTLAEKNKYAGLPYDYN